MRITTDDIVQAIERMRNAHPVRTYVTDGLREDQKQLFEEMQNNTSSHFGWDLATVKVDGDGWERKVKAMLYVSKITGLDCIIITPSSPIMALSPGGIKDADSGIAPFATEVLHAVDHGGQLICPAYESTGDMDQQVNLLVQTYTGFGYGIQTRNLVRSYGSLTLACAMRDEGFDIKTTIKMAYHPHYSDYNILGAVVLVPAMDGSFDVYLKNEGNAKTISADIFTTYQVDSDIDKTLRFHFPSIQELMPFLNNAREAHRVASEVQLAYPRLVIPPGSIRYMADLAQLEQDLLGREEH